LEDGIVKRRTEEKLDWEGGGGKEGLGKKRRR
jgi:hypothetical protein